MDIKNLEHGSLSPKDNMSTDIPNISGLAYVSDFISPEVEIQLLSIIDEQNWRADLKRRVQHYGYIYDYRARSISSDMALGPLPSWLDSVLERLTDSQIFRTRPDQVIVNEYQVGQGISPHIDCVPCFGEVIASLSLGSAVDMDFRRNEQRHVLRLEPRSLFILNDDARYRWTHSIANRKSDLVNSLRVPRSRRISLTFRTVKSDDNFTQLCE